ncbi:SGNH/GDSL hydrolase family protein [Amycolatopsis sp. NPDC059657]|uniref:SGNH/GDSL hydrolase family protein n=1 Tax=Amycolatopsis sp. NPDC059657 TaxID=3346899 RepID=UPI0036707C26
MIKTRSLVIGLTGLLLATGACSAQSTTSTPAAANQSKVVLLGDSVAVGQSLPLAAAFKAGNVGYQSLAAAGGGNVVGPAADQQWTTLPGEITGARPTVVVYQITTYDWGTQAEQQAAYEKLLNTVTGAGAKLVFVTMPPIKADDFYQSHMEELGRTSAVAAAVAAGSAGKATFLDATAVWGNTYQQTKDGKADRSADGIHTCPQGAARFTQWLLTELKTLLPGFTPPAPETWANTGWSADARFKGC